MQQFQSSSKVQWASRCLLALSVAVTAPLVGLSNDLFAQTVGSRKPPTALAGSKVRVEYSKIGDSAHFEFDGRAPEQFRLTKRQQEDGSLLVDVVVGPIDESSQDRIKSMKTDTVTVESIEVLSELQSKIVFRVPKQADYFEYFTEAPKRLVVDFFPRLESVTSQAMNSNREDTLSSQNAVANELKVNGAQKSLRNKSASKKASDLSVKKAGARNPAGGDFILVAKDGPDGVKLVPELTPLSEKIASEMGFERGVFDGGDPEFRRFTVQDYEVRKDAKIDSVAQIRIPFPALDLGFTQLDFILKNPPEYSIEGKDSDETKEARLILTLFKNNRPAVLLKTASDFLKKYPKSEYDEVIRYLMADTHYQLWRNERMQIEENKLADATRLHDTDFEEAMGLYNNLIEKYPDSPLNARTLLLVGFSYLNRGDSLGAMKTFQKFVRMQPGSPHGGQVKIAIARAYLALNRFDDAIRELDDVVNNAPQVADKDEALFRKGDVRFREGRYQDAVTAYEAAIAARPEAARRFPNAYYNLAEAQFRLNNEQTAISAYRKFLQKFPEHPYGGYAMTRLGELIESLVGSDDKRVTGAFFESYFRYRSTPGADIARMRVLASRIPDMKEREFKDAIREIDEIVKRQSDLPSIHEFKAITITDAFTKRGAYDRATEDLIRFYKENTQSRKLDLVKGRIVRNIVESIAAAVKKSDFFEALRRYSKDEEGWLKGVTRADLPFLVGRAYEIAGAPEAAERHYQATKALVDSRKQGEREPFELPITRDEVGLRHSKVLYEMGNSAEAQKKLQDVKTSSLNSAEKWEYSQLAADLSEARGDRAAAISFLKGAATQQGLKPLDQHRILSRLAQTQDREGAIKDADATLQEALNVLASHESDPEFGKQVVATREYRAKILIRLKQKQKALEELTIALNLADQLGQSDVRSARYLKGKLEFEQGDLKSAQSTWASLDGKQNDMWAQMAKEQMRSAQWKAEYKKYLERIPASQSLQ